MLILLALTLAQDSPYFLQLVLARSGQLEYLSTQGLAVVRGALVTPPVFPQDGTARARPTPHIPTPLFSLRSEITVKDQDVAIIETQLKATFWAFNYVFMT